MQNASSTTKQLYLFLAACSGNWRNSIYIKCQSDKDDPGYLLAADRDGQPVILGVRQFFQLTGMWIDPAECCGQLTEAGFESLYAQYLLLVLYSVSRAANASTASGPGYKPMCRLEAAN